jgi:hypothetical protein
VIPGGSNEQSLQVLLLALLGDWVQPLPAAIDTQSGFFGEAAYWRYGAANIVTVLAHPLQQRNAAKVSVQFEEGFRASNRLDTGARMKKGSVNVQLNPAQPAVVVGLPYEVRGLDLLTAPAVLPGEDLPYTINLDTGKDQP